MRGEFRSMWLFIVNSLLLFWFLRKNQDFNAKKNRKLRIFELMGKKKGFKFLLLLFSIHLIYQTNKAIWLYLTFFFISFKCV